MRRWAVLVAMLLVWAGCSSGEAATSSATTSSAATPTTQEAATTAATAATTTAPAATVPDDPTAGLADLPFGEFVDASFDLLLLRTPQLVTELGIAARYGIRNDHLDDLSPDYQQETMDMESAVLDLLRGYDRAALDEADQITYDVYEWYLDDLVRGHRFAMYDYPIHHMLGSYDWNTFFYFTDSFPLETPEDAEDFVAAVWEVGRQGAQVLDLMRAQEQLGIYPPDFILEMGRSVMIGQLALPAPRIEVFDPTRTAIYERFEEDTAALGIDPGAREALLGELADALTESLAPAWMDLIAEADRLADVAGPDAGVWKLPDGDAYYTYLLRRETSTELTAAEIHEIGLAEVDRIRGELRAVFDELGYPADLSLADAVARVAAEGGRTTDPIGTYTEYLARIEPLVDPVFGLRPEAEMAIVPDRSFGGGGGFYSPASLDGSRLGAFYVGTSGGAVPMYRMATTLHHEGVPGHHFQIALARELGLPLMRSVVNFNGYVEGWALYAEYLAKELGAYDDDVYGDVGRLHLELLRAVRLVTDTGIHAMGWTREEAQAYMSSAMGGWIHEVDRYIVLPAQATGYKIGMLEILRLRSLAEDELGDGFDPAAFHDVVIGHGSLPLEVLDRLVTGWIAEEQGRT
jgi:uncharacterized protein (DUF885 family)